MNKLWVTSYVTSKNYRKYKWGLIALVVGLSIVFCISLYFAIMFQQELNSFTTITLG
ncbi:hypothetical protein [Latilactobacillus graminis]|uniref:hypothetical protein n=1 Tax=Latilactobacillus graminis TaxID=60519 RepID=UPI000B046DF6|nr:hypothetical protein [Latilactobacillus graminis]